MAQAQSSDTDVSEPTANNEQPQTELTLTLEAEGEATRRRGTQTETTNFIVRDTVEVGIVHEMSTDTVAQQFVKERSVGTDEWQSIIRHNPRSVFREIINEQLSKDRVEVDRETFKQWNVTFDGDVRAWLDILEQFEGKGLKRAKKIADHDEFGDGLDAAIMELQRRTDE